MRSFSILASLVLAFLTPLAGAQSAPGGVRFTRMNQSLRPVELDLATGTITPGPASSDRGGSTVADFQNLDLNGFVGIDSSGGPAKWFCAGLKGSGSNQSTTASDLMDSVVFAYCSAALDPNSGGPGGSLTLGFYEGYTLTGGAPTTAVAVLALTGLPASPFAGGTQCYFLTIKFNTLVAFRDSGVGTHQGIGYSWTFMDLQPASSLAATYPFMACTTSCSGVVGVPDGQGMTDFIDYYAPGAAVPVTFTFGTTIPIALGSTFTSINMQIQEASDRLATSVGYNATITPNADTLTATTAILGNTWTATITKAVPSAAAAFTIRLRTSRSLPNGTTPAPPVTGRVLIAGPLLATLGGAHNGTTGAIAAGIPLQLGFCGVHFAAQSTTFGGGIKLSSAVEGTVGTL